MWYLGERVTPQHSAGGRFVPMGPPESMLAKIVEVARLYAEAVEAGGESICLPWENFVDKRRSTKTSCRDLLHLFALCRRLVCGFESCILAFLYSCMLFIV